MAKGKNSYVPKFVKDELREINYCEYCGSTQNLCIDHYLPPQKGGQVIRSNFVRSCVSCNSSKSDKKPLDWLDHLIEKRDRAELEFKRFQRSVIYIMKREGINHG